MSFLRKRKKRFEYGNCPPHKRHAMDQVPLEYGKQAKKTHNDVGAGELEDRSCNPS